jgi:glycosyltransferase involved in cell wall biosynthesis
METNNHFKLCILMPVYNEMDVAELLIKRLDDVLDVQTLTTTVILIDDGSTSPMKKEFLTSSLKNISAVDIVNLQRNLGHQRAIAVGLTLIHEKYSCDAVIVMDADGEDKPEDVPRLIQLFKDSGGDKIIFAERLKRSEGFIFKISYKAYQLMHYILTGIPVKVGNFSILPFKRLSALVLVSELWNHYAAAVFSSRLPYATLPTRRGNRLGGKSTMNFTALVLHGLSAISVFTDIAGVRLLLFSFFMSFLLIAILGFIMLVRITSIVVIPGWLSSYTVFLLVLILQISGGCFAMVFFILMNRTNLNFIPKRDCKHFIETVRRTYTSIE